MTPMTTSATPILNGEQPLPARKVRWVPALLVGFALGGILIALDRAKGSTDPLIPPLAFPAFVLAFYCAVFVHELGHLLAGKLMGFELRTFMVGVFLFEREAHGWRFRVVLRHLFWGGLTAARPRTEQDLLNRYLRVVLGGPAASLVLLVITFLLPAGVWTRALLWVNLLLTISVCVPYMVAFLPNDARLVLLLTRKGAVGDRLVATLYLLTLDAQGKQPREWPPALIEKLDIGNNDKSRLPVVLGLLLSCAAEKEDAEGTAEILEPALAISHKMLPGVRRAFLAAAASYHGFHCRDASRAEEWVKRARSVKSAVSPQDWDSRAQAAVCFAKGEYTQSARFLERYIALLDRQPTSGMIIAERSRTIALMNGLTAEAS
jgi:hypothetical protein